MTHFYNKIIAWHDKYGRKDLPWQINATPYTTWVSEIMLQQTQVTTVIPYFTQFMITFPDIYALAEANPDQVMNHWSGLGYYSRARNLHQCAQTIVDDYQGKFPDTTDALMTLPGIGRSTAGAIISLAFGQPATILDGNVKRVLARHEAIEGWPGKTTVHNQLWAIAEKYTPKTNCNQYTQAMMDLGATLCTRSKPRCIDCPVKTTCQAFKTHTQAHYPGKKPKKTLPTKQAYLLLIQDDKQLLLHKRPAKGIWGGLWSLPEVEFDTALTDIQQHCQQHLGITPQNITPWTSFRHTFSHYHFEITPLHMSTNTHKNQSSPAPAHAWHNIETIQQALGIPAPLSKLLDLLDQLT